MPEQLPPESFLRASLDKFAAEEAKRTTIAVEGTKADGVTGSITTSGGNDKVAWSFGAWVRRKFQRGGTSGGIKGEIKF